jgi:esterase
VILHSKHHPGPGPAVVILHGLYGNHGNWAPQARQLAQDFNVYVLDARNHGLSPWADSMRLEEMAKDVADTLDALGLPSAHLVGHSMGGKIAMLLALTQAQRVLSLCVVDIAPVAYLKAEGSILTALGELDLVTLQSRVDADAKLSERIREKSVRDFLLTNLQRNEQGGWRWRFNLPVLTGHFSEITAWPLGFGSYPGQVLFIKGELSDYILPAYQPVTLMHFSQAKFKVVNGAGHWVHSEKMEAVLRLIKNFVHP